MDDTPARQELRAAPLMSMRVPARSPSGAARFSLTPAASRPSLAGRMAGHLVQTRRTALIRRRVHDMRALDQLRDVDAGIDGLVRAAPVASRVAADVVQAAHRRLR